METLHVAFGEAREAGGRGRRDGVENAEQRVGIAFLVAGDQFGVIEIVAGIHAHARRQLAAHVDLLLARQQRDLTPSTLAAWAPMMSRQVAMPAL